VYFHYDDTGLLAEYDASGQLISEYQYQPGNHWMTHPLFKRDGATGKVHYYYNSHLGQPLKLFDKAGRTTWSARSQAKRLPMPCARSCRKKPNRRIKRQSDRLCRLQYTHAKSVAGRLRG